MKKIVIAIILSFVVVFAMTALAGEQSVRLNSATVLNGQKIAPGNYTVRYEIKGTTAEVKFIQNDKTVVTATGDVVENPAPASYDGLVRVNNTDGTNSVKEIQFANKKQVIRFEKEAPAAGK